MAVSAMSRYGALSIGSNRLLESVAPEVKRAVLAHAKTITADVEMSIYEREAVVEQCYFPLGGMISYTTTLKTGEMVEVGIAGCDGFAGVPVILGTKRSANKVFVQIAGEALRVSAVDLLAVCRELPDLRALLLRYIGAVLAQSAQLSACNRIHETEQRLARWLLMVRDRMDSDKVPLTQEFLAMMLGTQRSTVSVAAGVLQREGMLEYARGHIVILDRERLEHTACECYAVFREQTEEVFHPH